MEGVEGVGEAGARPAHPSSLRKGQDFCRRYLGRAAKIADVANSRVFSAATAAKESSRKNTSASKHFGPTPGHLSCLQPSQPAEREHVPARETRRTESPQLVLIAATIHPAAKKKASEAFSHPHRCEAEHLSRHLRFFPFGRRWASSSRKTQSQVPSLDSCQHPALNQSISIWIPSQLACVCDKIASCEYQLPLK